MDRFRMVCHRCKVGEACQPRRAVGHAGAGLGGQVQTEVASGETRDADIHLSFSDPNLTASAGEADPSGFPSLSSAMKKVGLTLKAGRGPVNVVVINSVERPSAN